MLSLILLFVAAVTAQNACNTDQNPSCAGNKVFEQICCPAPNLCYWQDRQGTPGCCPAGQDCLDGGQPVTPAPPVIKTSTIYPSTITITPTPAQTVTGGGVIVVTQNNPVTVTTVTNGNCGGGCATVTSYAGGAYSTVTSVVGGGFSTVTSAAGSVYSTVSGILVGSPASTIEMPSIWTTLIVLLAGPCILLLWP